MLRSGERQAVQVQCVVSKRLWCRESECDGRYGLSLSIDASHSDNDRNHRVRPMYFQFVNARCRTSVNCMVMRTSEAAWLTLVLVAQFNDGSM